MLLDIADRSDDQPLGTFRLVSTFSNSSSALLPPLSAPSSHSFTLAGWHPLQPWPTQPPKHKLRDPPSSVSDNSQGGPGGSTKGSLTSFSSGPGTYRKSKADNTANQTSTSRKARGDVAVVPANNDSAICSKPESKQKGLQEFLDSEEEEADDREEETSDESSDDDDDEEEEEVAEDEDDNSEEQEDGEESEESESEDDVPSQKYKEPLIKKAPPSKVT